MLPERADGRERGHADGGERPLIDAQVSAGAQQHHDLSRLDAVLMDDLGDPGGQRARLGVAPRSGRRQPAPELGRPVRPLAPCGPVGDEKLHARARRPRRSALSGRDERCERIKAFTEQLVDSLEHGGGAAKVPG